MFSGIGSMACASNATWMSVAQPPRSTTVPGMRRAMSLRTSAGVGPGGVVAHAASSSTSDHNAPRRLIRNIAGCRAFNSARIPTRQRVVDRRAHRRDLRVVALLRRRPRAVGIDLGGGPVARVGDARAQAELAQRITDHAMRD